MQENQGRYRKMEGSIEFSASNRCNYPPGRRSDSKGRGLCMVRFKLAEFFTFFITEREPEKIWGNGGDGWIQRIKED